MTAYFDDGQVTLLLGDVRECLQEMPAESVNCVVTSPPYWSLRDYGVEPTVWGGEGGCDAPRVMHVRWIGNVPTEKPQQLSLEEPS